MEKIYLIIIIILFVLAVFDLFVGVSNDAVNFLSSAIGSQSASKRAIFFVASVGILIGATFSSGMMEVARKGIFHPEMFVFSEIMIIFLAVMITDIILLDLFNTFGLPTSTTVSIVFELLGAAVAVALVKIKSSSGAFGDLAQYINSGKVLVIVSGILISILIAFFAGTIVQYITRMIFTFNFQKIMRYAGAVFGGLAITVISYFILIKGIAGSSFAEIPVGAGKIPLSEWAKNNTLWLLLSCFAGFTLLMQALYYFFKIDILKIVVLTGTFALAMAFAGNDLVNFIGVPIAGFHAYNAWSASTVAPGNFGMDMLAGDVQTPAFFLVLSGIIMIITLFTSKKAGAVIETGINLSRQSEGVERFGSSAVARLIVRNAVTINKKVKRFIPIRMYRAIEKRFRPYNPPAKSANPPAFDKVRASVNLMLASVLIAMGTSLKLPLSTTYVTFMVAMGSSLADRAWDRESAVFRVSGVFAVIGGWFLTAIIAFTVSAFMAWLISAGKFPVVLGLVVLVFIVMIRTRFIFNKQNKKSVEEDDFISEKDETEKIFQKCKKNVIGTIMSSNQIYSLSLYSFRDEDRSHMHDSIELNNELNRRTKKQKNKLFDTIAKIQKMDTNSEHFYIQIIDYQREIAHALTQIVTPLSEHLENQHKPFEEVQSNEIQKLIMDMDEFYNHALHVVKEDRFEKNIDELIYKRELISELIQNIKNEQIIRIRNNKVNSRNSELFFGILNETKNLLYYSIELVKSYKDFFTLMNLKSD